MQENGYGDLYKSASGNFFADLFSFGNSGGSININDDIDAEGEGVAGLGGGGGGREEGQEG